MNNDMEEIKYDILKRLHWNSERGEMPLISINTMFESKRRNYVNKNFFVSFEIFNMCIEELVRDGIIYCFATAIQTNERFYKLTNDFSGERDTIGRYLYLKEILEFESKL